MRFERVSSDIHAVIGSFIGIDYYFLLRSCSRRLRAQLTRDRAPALWSMLGLDWIERARGCPDRHTLLSEICAAGDHFAAMWLSARFSLGKYTDPVPVFFTACMHGHRSIVQWLVSRFELESAAQRGVCLACLCGHLATASWIADQFRLAPVHPRLPKDSYINAWCGACGRGHLAVVKWMASYFDLSLDDARSHDNYALRASCSEGHLAVAEWLVDRFDLSALDAQTCRAAQRCALAGGHPQIARWLGARFELAVKRLKLS